MAKALGKVLVVDDNEDILLAAKMLLKKHADMVQVENTPNRIPFLMHNDSYDVILLDMNFTKDITSGKEGFHWLKQILEIDPAAVVVLFTAYGDVEMAVQALKEGATDFVLKPWQNEKLLGTLTSAARLKGSYREVEKLKQTQSTLSSELNKPYEHVIGEKGALKSIFDLINKVATTDANVLVLGENGTGKEVIARAIHNRSLRKENVFISVDMGTITESLFESELFGHKKGSFTDAKEDRIGRFEAANQGSIFLDEIGNLSLPLQSKLLTVLQQRQIVKVGSNKPVDIDIRLISATNVPLHEMVEKNEFRQDLIYRLNTVEIKLPPLRDRIEDLPELCNFFISTYAKKYRRDIKGIAPIALKRLEKYHWPGNIRELQHAIERAMIMCDMDILQAHDFGFSMPKAGNEEDVDLSDFDLDTVEKLMIQKAMSRNHGNISKAAKDLGLTRAALYRRLEKHGL